MSTKTEDEARYVKTKDGYDVRVSPLICYDVTTQICNDRACNRYIDEAISHCAMQGCKHKRFYYKLKKRYEWCVFDRYSSREMRDYYKCYASSTLVIVIGRSFKDEYHLVVARLSKRRLHEYD